MVNPLSHCAPHELFLICHVSLVSFVQKQFLSSFIFQTLTFDHIKAFVYIMFLNFGLSDVFSRSDASYASLEETYIVIESYHVEHYFDLFP